RRSSALPPPGDSRDPFEHTIFLVSRDGSRLRALSPPGLSARGPVFAPDGLSVVYFGHRSGDPSEQIALYRTTLDGRTEQLSFGDMQIFPSGLSFSPAGQ